MSTPGTFLNTCEHGTDIDWARQPGYPVALAPEFVQIGTGTDAFEVAVAVAIPEDRAPKAEDVRALWKARWNRRAAPVALVVAYKDTLGAWKASVCGTKDDPAVITNLDLGQVDRICCATLAAPDPASADRTFHRLLVGQKDALVAGLTNSGLFASHELRHGVPNRPDFTAARTAAQPLLTARGADLIRGLGFSMTPHGSMATILSADGANRAVAVLLDEHEVFDRASDRFGATSPVAQGMAIATAQNLPWLLITKGTQIRLYPTNPDLGVGRKGQAETYTEIDLALLAEADAAYLTLLFSAAALAEDGSAHEILAASADHAAALGARLRTRVYHDVVPELAVAVANEMGAETDEDLAEAYHRTLTILFRLLFVAYAEDRGLLPYQRNPRYTRKALKTLAREFADDPDAEFDPDATDRWEDLLAVWKAVDDGNKEWGVPAYNGGLFAADENHLTGQAIAQMTLTNAQIGPALRDLLIDKGDDGTLGPVDFRSLSVREFGTIYEGLLESSLSVAPTDLVIDPDTDAYLPAAPGQEPAVSEGDIYFHNASGARKATGSYFTKKFAVEHLLESALEPALTAHLAKVEQHRAAGDQAKAAETFFDFRIADLAMGSGHFLVAAIDRIERRLSAYLVEHPLPAVNDEIARLAMAATDALGPNMADIEIETSALLRRQIARRCIYGLDLNLMAVELARLGIWIHTFVPGLPMSALDHGLVVGSSLSGIGTVDEVLDVLEPDRNPDQPSLFSEQFTSELGAARDRLLRVARTAEATKAEVRAASKAHRQALDEAADAKALMDAAVAVRLGIADLPASVDLALNTGRRADVQQQMEDLQVTHLPYRFPEVFLRENPGFDVLIGNPPWEKVRHEPTQFWVIRDPGLRALKGTKRDQRIAWLRANRPQDAEEERQEMARREVLKGLLAVSYKWQKSQHYDFAKVFAERNMTLLRSSGSLGVVLPQALLVLGGWSPIRSRMIRDHHMRTYPLRNKTEWLFDSVHQQLTICLVTLTPGRGVTVHAAADSLTRFRDEQGKPGLDLTVEALTDLSEELNVPWFEQPGDPDIFLQMAAHPHLGTATGWVTGFADSTRWDFSGSGKHKTYATEQDTPGAWRVTMTRHVDAYAMTDDPEGKRIARPTALAALGAGVELRNGQPIVNAAHPPLIYRFPTNNDNSRTLIATALPDSGWLFSKGYAHGVRMPEDTPLRDILALLGYLNSVPADWWARRFVDRHLGKRIIEGMPLPDWSETERDAVAHLVTGLLRGHGYTTIAGGRALPDVPASADPIADRAAIDAAAMRGFRLTPAQVETMCADFEVKDDALPTRQRELIRAHLSAQEALV